MIARARVKAIDDVDPRLLCCDGVRETFIREKGRELLVNPSATRRVSDSRCIYCNKPAPAFTIVEIVGKSIQGASFIFLEGIDLDEGGVEL